MTFGVTDQLECTAGRFANWAVLNDVGPASYTNIPLHLTDGLANGSSRRIGSAATKVEGYHGSDAPFCLVGAPQLEVGLNHATPTPKESSAPPQKRPNRFGVVRPP
jgi:hypothetical protein